MTSTEWMADERRLAAAVGVSRLAVCLLLALLSAYVSGRVDEAFFLLFGLVPASYFTLFALVLPSL